MLMLRKWMLALVAAMAFTVVGGNLNPVSAQMTAPGTVATPAGKMTKKLPPRDAKGRFMKSAAATPKPMHALPPRDAKGHFMKSAAATPKPTKKLPPRDAKGRFMKKTTSPAPPK